MSGFAVVDETAGLPDDHPGRRLIGCGHQVVRAVKARHMRTRAETGDQFQILVDDGQQRPQRMGAVSDRIPGILFRRFPPRRFRPQISAIVDIFRIHGVRLAEQSFPDQVLQCQDETPAASGGAGHQYGFRVLLRLPQHIRFRQRGHARDIRINMDPAFQCLGAEFRMAGRGRFHQNDVQTGFVQHFVIILIKGNIRQFIFQRTLISAGKIALLVKTVRIQVADGDRLETVDPVVGPFQHGPAAVSQSDTGQSKFTNHKKPSFQ